jgi:hypothetical protein
VMVFVDNAGADIGASLTVWRSMSLLIVQPMVQHVPTFDDATYRSMPEHCSCQPMWLDIRGCC